MYKSKAKKVQPVNEADQIGEAPGGKDDWYERSRVRDTQQDQHGRFQHLLLPRFSNLPRGSRLTPERLAKLNVGSTLWPEERALFNEMMLNREGAIAFEWPEYRRFHEDVSPPVIIKTIPHKAWQAPNFPLPRALVPEVTKIVQERLDKGVLELSEGPYRNAWFLVKKKEPGKYRLINSATMLNAVTRRDANLPPSVDEFSKEFAGCQMASLMDLYSGYDQQILHQSSRDITAFYVPHIGLVRNTTLPQGCTNSVAQFVRTMSRILKDIMPTITMPFLDDIGVKGPYTDYNQATTLPGIRQFVMEHITNLDKTLERLERAGATIGAKSQFCLDGLDIVGYACNSGGREPSATHLVKIQNWEEPKHLSDVKGFLGLVVYFRIWIKDFRFIAEPLYNLLRKGVPFLFELDGPTGKAMKALQNALCTSPVLCRVDYSEGAREIVVAVDSSGFRWGGYLGQRDLDSGRVRPARYESRCWNKAERNYDATKREYKGVLCILKKLKIWLIGVHFILETDANTLVAQLNGAVNDHPGAMLTRWLTWIRLFDFEVRHIKGSTYTAADALSRRPRHLNDTDHDDDASDNNEDWILSELGAYKICPVELDWVEEVVEIDPELIRRNAILQDMRARVQ